MQKLKAIIIVATLMTSALCLNADEATDKKTKNRSYATVKNVTCFCGYNEHKFYLECFEILSDGYSDLIHPPKASTTNADVWADPKDCSSSANEKEKVLYTQRENYYKEHKRIKKNEMVGTDCKCSKKMFRSRYTLDCFFKHNQGKDAVDSENLGFTAQNIADKEQCLQKAKRINEIKLTETEQPKKD
jgi:hypothetical protein